MLLGKFGNNINIIIMKKNIVKKLGSELIVDFLVEKKVKHVFDLAGGMIAYLEEAISKKKGIECVPMHHEQAAGFAAEGYARNGQNFGVAIATSGPGATNLITAIGNCYFDSIPTMFVVGQVHTNNIKKNNNVRQEGFQETDIVSIVKPLTKYAVLIKDPSLLIYEIEKAYYIMKKGRYGPVLIDAPIDIQRTEIELINVKHFFGSKEHKLMQKQDDLLLSKKIDNKKVLELKKLLEKAKAPIVIIGNGIRLSQSSDELIDFVKRNNLPVVSSLMGLDSYPHADKNFIGYIGSNGNRDANIIFANADLIVALGTRLDVRQIGDSKFFAKTATLVHVDIDGSSIDYNVKSNLSFETDIKNFFKSTKNLNTQIKPDWFKFINSVQKEFVRPLSYNPKEVDPNTFISELSNLSSKNAVMVADVGQNQMWCAQSWKTKKGQRLLFSGGMGSMGFSLPAAIGSWYANKKSEVMVVCGDGGFQMNVQEMETVSRNKIPLKLFVLNNKSLGMVREFQDMYFNKNYQSTVNGYGCPDLEKVAHSYEFDYVRITGVSKDDATVKKILDYKTPVLIEVDLDMMASLQPKVVYGHALDDQFPYLDEKQKIVLEKLKANLKAY